MWFNILEKEEKAESVARRCHPWPLAGIVLARLQKNLRDRSRTRTPGGGEEILGFNLLNNGKIPRDPGK
jgi:hypothetical protein